MGIAINKAEGEKVYSQRGINDSYVVNRSQ